jgi:hypothetical protein
MFKLLSQLKKTLWSRNRIPSRLITGLAAACLCLAAPAARAATFTASLDRDTVTLGESVTLSLAFTGTSSQSELALPAIPNLQIQYVGPSSQFSMVNGQITSSVTHNYSVTPRQAGDFTIPGFTVNLDGEKLTSQPLTLKVLKPGAPSSDAINSGSQLAFLKLLLPKTEVYVGETVTAELDLYLNSKVRNVGQFQLTTFPSDGFNVGKMVEGQRRQTQVGNTVYTVIPLLFPFHAIKAGSFSVGPVTASVVVAVPSGNRRRDPFYDPFEMLGGGNEQKQLTLATDPESVQSLLLPRENVPADFNGAVGSYSMTLNAGPTTLTVGDPITVKIQISGRGALDSLTLPDQPGWRDFKTYPPTTKVDTTDALGLQGTKTFEQIIVPQNADIKQLPPVSFSYFNPDQKSYRTLSQPAVPLVVRPANAAALPTVLGQARATQDSPPPAQDIIPNKQHLGAVARMGPPLAQQPWFLALQGLPILAFVSALTWRKRAEMLANNPRLRRQRQVAQIVRDGLARLHELVAANKSDEFFATLFHLLQEQLGERLDLPASAITEAVIDEHLRPRGVAESTLSPLQELFQTCNLVRYAPIKTSQELAAVIQKLETVLRELQNLKA